jgi:hypothetical protein
LQSLVERGYDYVSSLPEDCVRDFDFGRPPELAKIDLTLYKDTQPDGRIRLIVQVFKRRFLVNLIWAVGVFLAREGAPTPVPENQLWEYM